MHTEKHNQPKSNASIKQQKAFGKFNWFVLIGFIITFAALFTSSQTANPGGATWTNALFSIVFILIGFFVWAAAFSFVGIIPGLAVLWVILGVAFLYVFPFLMWFM